MNVNVDVWSRGPILSRRPLPHLARPHFLTGGDSLYVRRRTARAALLMVLSNGMGVMCLRNLLLRYAFRRKFPEDYNVRYIQLRKLQKKKEIVAHIEHEQD
ncbi:hypothetical protein EVAR_77510_1 [Eumeta japonica]|uniref:Uncharacterized protein n=1 Tax=Eumeta variegata TaxID=151549 RepID=A0A4C1T9B4_EUMVA|nr:hypothetical protein EVAR_77510_1 [Eumeta japonica]